MSTLLDLLLVLAFLLLSYFGKIAVTTESLAVLVAVICATRVMKGERL